MTCIPSGRRPWALPSSRPSAPRLPGQTQVTEAKNQGLGANPCQILGGEDFPQGTTLTLEINGGLFTGYFAGNLFYIESRSWPDGEEQAANEAADRNDPCPYDAGNGQMAPFDYRIDVPCGCGDTYAVCECRHNGFIISTGGSGTTISDDPIIQQSWAEPGSTVRIYSGEPITYIVSITYGDHLHRLDRLLRAGHVAGREGVTSNLRATAAW